MFRSGRGALTLGHGALVEDDTAYHHEAQHVGNGAGDQHAQAAGQQRQPQHSRNPAVEEAVEGDAEEAGEASEACCEAPCDEDKDDEPKPEAPTVTDDTI